MADEVTLKLSTQQQEILDSLKKARQWKEIADTPGYYNLMALMDLRVKQIEEQFFNTDADKDTLWAMQVRLKGIKEFVQGIKDTVIQSIQTLEDPRTEEMILASLTLDPADLSGELREPDEIDKQLFV